MIILLIALMCLLVASPMRFGPGVILPGLLALLFGWKSMKRGEESAAIREESTQPGAQPGTNLDVDVSGLPADVAAMIQAGAPYDPRLGILPAQYEANRQALNAQKGYADTNLQMFEDSPIGGLAERFGGSRASFEDWLAGKGPGNDPYSSRVRRYDTAATDITGRVRALSDKVTGSLEKTMADPTIMTDQEMQTIIGRQMAGNRQTAENRMRAAEETAGARGLGPGQVAALREQIAGGQRLQDLDVAESVAAANAENRAKLQLAATEALGGVGGGLAGTEAQILAGLGGLSDRYVQAIPGMYGAEADLWNAYNIPLAAARESRAALEQPENYALVGDLLNETNRYNTLLRSGAEGDLAQLFGNMSNASLSFLGNQLNAKLMAQAAANQGGSGFGGLGTGLGMLGGLGVSALLPGAMTPIGALIGMGVGGATGGGIGGMFK